VGSGGDLRGEELSSLRAAIDGEMTQAVAELGSLLDSASPDDLRRPSVGTRWTNRQLLFHMVFGYCVVRSLMPLVHTLGRLGWSRRFAATLNAGRGPFHVVNYAGSVVGGQVLPTSVVLRLMHQTVAALERRLDRETAQSLALTMCFPTDWDPYFRPVMKVEDVYRYGRLHFSHHRRQLTM